MGAVGFHSAFSALPLVLLAASSSLGLRCKEREHVYGGRCCKDCAPGEGMQLRCTARQDTVCRPCREGHFSSEHSHRFCSSCTVCDTWKGSVEVKKCEKTSDRICRCRAGYMPVLGTTPGSVCSPCPEGSYSLGHNEDCQPWTNCSLLGKATLQAGTKSTDAVCSNHASHPASPQSATPAWNLSTSDHQDSVSTAASSPARPSLSPSICLDTNSSPTETNWGSLSLILVCLMLLLVSGISILLLVIQAAKNQSKKRPCRSNLQQPQSCRIPVQEEHIDSNSTLIKN
ncbi:tumor necrosis factor receptor superfamily member 4 [Dryobates pubescens]|nr:tumor necrosis factor receptor superfamily member 4 [Dryobates pubescens]